MRTGEGMSEEESPQLCLRLLLHFSSFSVSRLLSRPFKALVALRSSLLPYKAAALCSQSPTCTTDVWMRHKLPIIVSPEDAVRTMPRRALWLKPCPRLGAFIPLSCDASFFPSILLPLPQFCITACHVTSIHPVLWHLPVLLLSQSITVITLNEWNIKQHMNDKIGYLPLEVWDFFSSSNSPSFLQLFSALPTSIPRECPNTWNGRRRYLPHSLSTPLLSAALSVVPSSSHAFTYWLSLCLPTSSRFFCRTAYQQQSRQCLCRNVINLTFGMDSRLSAVQLVWSPIWKTHCWCWWGKCIFIEILFQHFNVLLWFSCSLDRHHWLVLNCIWVGCPVRLIMKYRSFAPQVFSSSPTCCLCSLEGSQSFSWRLHLDNSWSKGGSLPGTLHPSLKVSGLVSDIHFTVTPFLDVPISPSEGSSHPPQVWAWPQWWLCSSVTHTTSWFWFGGSIFSFTPSPPRCPGPPVGTPGTPRTAQRISGVPATTVALPSPCRRSPLLVCSPPHPWWTCL